MNYESHDPIRMKSKFRVLFLDDEPDILKQAKIFLESEDERLEVETCLTVEDALELLKERNYDVVVSDYQMPEADGIEFLRIVREERESDIPFIILTQKGREEVALEALKMGANRYMQKSGDPKAQYGELAHTITREVERFRNDLDYKVLTESSINGIYLFQEGKFKFVNDGLVRISGYSREELETMNYLDLVHPDNREETIEGTRRALEGDVYDLPLSRELKALRKDGETIWIQLNTRIIEYGGKPAIIGNVTEITRQKKIEAKLEETLREYQIIFDNVQNSMFLIDVDDDEFRFQKLNPQHEEKTGIKTEDVKGKTPVEVLGEEQGGKLNENYRKCIRKGEPITYEEILKLPTGEKKWLTRLAPVKIEGEVKKIVGAALDITEQKKTEEKYRIMTEGSINGIYVFQEGKFKFVNKGLIDMSGYSRGELENINYLELIHPDYRDKTRKYIEKALKGNTLEVPEKYELKALKKDDSSIWVQLKNNIIEYEGKPAIIGNVTDITERKKADERKRFLLDFQKIATDASSLYIDIQTEEEFDEATNYILEQLGRLFTVDRSYIFLFSSDLSTMTNTHEWCAKDIEPQKDKIQQFPTDALPWFTNKIKKRDPIHIPNVDKLPPEAKAEKKEFKSQGIKSLILLPMINKKRKLIGFMGLDSVKKLKSWQNEQIRMLQLIAEIISNSIQNIRTSQREDFLHSILRHDILNKAQIIQGYHELLKDHELSGKAKDYLEKAEKAVTDSINLIDKIKTLIKIDEKDESREINIDSIIKKAINETEAQALEKGIKINHEDLDCRVLGGPLLMELFLNLIENAIIHSNCSQIRISGRETNGKCIIKVEDDGCGIPDEHKERIFEREYKTGRHSGSGLGTYIIKKITEEYNGNIEVKDSELGGARFDIRLEKNRF